jgi:hypothetical protein
MTFPNQVKFKMAYYLDTSSLKKKNGIVRVPNLINYVLKKNTLELAKLMFVCLFVLSLTSNFSAIWRLSTLPVTGLQI